MNASPFQFFACPTTGTPLSDTGPELSGTYKGQTLHYPKIENVPWLYPDPLFTLAHWRNRISTFLEVKSQEIAELKEIIRETGRTADLNPIRKQELHYRKQRLESLRQNKITQYELLKKVLQPIKYEKKISLAQEKAFGFQLPFHQGLLSYFPNMARDWAVNQPLFEKENKTLFDSVLNLISETATQDQAGLNIAVLGSGAGRLAYDLAKYFINSRIVALDLNPLLLLAGNQINLGKSLKGSFPIPAPLNQMKQALDLELAAPNGPATNLECVLGDVYSPPFQESSFDLVITPWLIDILPRKFRTLVESMAMILKPGGFWINCGSWFFNFQNEEDNLSYEEASEIGIQSDFQPILKKPFETPYLQSDENSHRRTEILTGFLWEKPKSHDKTKGSNDDRVSRLNDQIEWLRTPGLAIPSLPAFQESLGTYSTMAWVLSQIDGNKSLNDLITLLMSQTGLDRLQAQDALISFFDRYLRDRKFRDRT